MELAGVSGWQVNPALSQVLLASTLPTTPALAYPDYLHPNAATIFSEIWASSFSLMLSCGHWAEDWSWRHLRSVQIWGNVSFCLR